MLDYAITLTDSPTQDEAQALRHGLSSYNLANVPALEALTEVDLGIFSYDDQQQLKGGVTAELSWGWLYIDTLWVHESLRHRQMGTRLMDAIEDAALQRGIDRAYLFTTSFQARPFYEKRGYTVWAQLTDCPPGHTYYYLRKESLTPSNTDPGLRVIEDPDRATVRQLEAGLIDHANQYAQLNGDFLAIFVKDPAGQVLGGLMGATYWTWFDMRYFWLDARLRGQGLGRQILAQAEVECLRRGVRGIFTDTADFQSLDFYRHHGFEVNGTLDDRPPGHRSYFLKKILASQR